MAVRRHRAPRPSGSTTVASTPAPPLADSEPDRALNRARTLHTMALKGDLASVDLAQMFQMLALNKKVGLLSIQSPRFWKILYFDARGVTLYYNPHDLLDRTIAAFVRCGRLLPQAVEEIRAHASRNQLPLLDALLAGGYLREADLAEQMQYELEEEVYDLFFCKDARFEFHEGVNKVPERE